MSHILYVVGTPIGNLEDITPHALRVLREVSLVAAENPTRTLRLFARYEIDTPMMRFTDAYDRKKAVRLQGVLHALEKGDVALVSEAGMPLLADPGYELVRTLLARQIEVQVVPGPTALDAALSVSGLADGGPFVFLGFSPRRPGARRQLLSDYAHPSRTLVLYESPKRVLDTLRDARDVLGSRQVAVACELTKLYEQVWRGDLDGAIAYLEADPPRGEYVLIIGGEGAHHERTD